MKEGGKLENPKEKIMKVAFLGDISFNDKYNRLFKEG